MSSIKPSLPRGTRDFPPDVMVRRNFILNTIRKAFEKYGFLPLETPALENLSVLKGKYGDEGDQLLFKILNSGNFLSKVDQNSEVIQNYNLLINQISEKGLRYDLTVPLARYVVMNRHEIVFPFKRYQIQPVWRADRPQKGRYREFFQCDADIIGTNSVICEAEIAMLVHEVFDILGIKDYVLKINNRKILEGIAEIGGDISRANEFFVILDKLDKIGIDNFRAILKESGFSSDFINNVDGVVSFQGDNKAKIDFLKDNLNSSKVAMEGIQEIIQFFDYAKSLGVRMSNIDFDITLARGLSYYTGIILETISNRIRIGSIGGGGRYDNLTGVFGLPDMSGVGFSFGIDRIYDVMQELNLFSNQHLHTTQVLITNFDSNTEKLALTFLSKLRKADIKAEIFPDKLKLKKQLNYANKKDIQFVLMIGSEEFNKGVCTLKEMKTGKQKELTIEEVIDKITKTSKKSS